MTAHTAMELQSAELVCGAWCVCVCVCVQDDEDGLNWDPRSAGSLGSGADGGGGGGAVDDGSAVLGVATLQLAELGLDAHVSSQTDIAHYTV